MLVPSNASKTWSWALCFQQGERLLPSMTCHYEQVQGTSSPLWLSTKPTTKAPRSQGLVIPKSKYSIRLPSFRSQRAQHLEPYQKQIKELLHTHRHNNQSPFSQALMAALRLMADELLQAELQLQNMGCLQTNFLSNVIWCMLPSCSHHVSKMPLFVHQTGWSCLTRRPVDPTLRAQWTFRWVAGRWRKDPRPPSTRDLCYILLYSV